MSLFSRMTPYTKDLTDDIRKRLDAQPRGVVGVCSGFLGRYREFDKCLDLLWMPPGSKLPWCLGVDVTDNFNNMARVMMGDPDLQWLFILGDDHVFTQDLLLNLLERQVEVVVPLCLRKSEFTPVLNHGADGGYKSIPNSWPEFLGKKGLIEWKGTCGNAGMLIRRKVFEALEQPYFQAGQLDKGTAASDLFFCQAVQKAGFKVHIDLDNTIGHIIHAAIWPKQEENGDWSAEFRFT